MNPRQFARYASIAALLMASNAQAQLFRAYLSGSGNDGNACTLQAPCRLLPAALSAVADGGEVWMLDSANYNTSTVSVGKSVSILAIPGAVGSVVALDGGPAVSITVPGLTVALRNVVIGPVASMAPGTNGVEISADSSLVIEGSLIVNLVGSGVVANGAADVRLVNTTVRNNGEWALRATDGVAGTVSKSQLVGNTLGGVRAEGLTGAAITNVSVTDSPAGSRLSSRNSEFLSYTCVLLTCVITSSCLSPALWAGVPGTTRRTRAPNRPACRSASARCSGCTPRNPNAGSRPCLSVSTVLRNASSTGIAKPAGCS